LEGSRHDAALHSPVEWLLSRKMENHAAATALNYFSYNFIKIHRTLSTSPVMASGVTDRLWSVEDLVALWEAYEQRGGGKSGINESSIRDCKRSWRLFYVCSGFNSNIQSDYLLPSVRSGCSAFFNHGALSGWLRDSPLVGWGIYPSFADQDFKVAHYLK
jgi:hypothetical protein